MRILYVEDDEPIAEVIKQGLESVGYLVDVEYDGVSGLERAAEKDYALLILDVMLPRMDGWEICRRLREQRNRVPVLMLTARDALDDKVRGFETGADDYLAKPFEFAELLARIRALLRRDKIHKARIIHIADLEIDTGLKRVLRSGKEISLTPNEYLLLEAMAQREGATLSREYIQENVWMDEDSFSNTVDVCIAQLRKKIDAGRDDKLIHTIHRLGYAIKRPEEQ